MNTEGPGTEIAGYRIESLIGRGGMAVVYRAEDTRLGRKVALKLLTPQLADSEQFRQRFIRESRVAASLDHPNIVPIYEAGEADGQLFIAMRYVIGSDLKGLLAEEGGPLAVDRTLRLFVQIGDALDTAHEAGLVHRDVKPGNVLVVAGHDVPRYARGDHVYLTDFGLTKRTSELTGGLTGTGHFLGTVDYVSPEQIQGKPVGPGTDIYALGCVLYECLTGQLPFRRDDDAALLWAHLVEEPPPITGIRPEIPAGVNGVVARAIAKDPADRYRSCAELVRDLELALGVPAPVSSSGGRRNGDRAAATSAGTAAATDSPRVESGTVTGDMPGGSQHPSFPPGPPVRFPSQADAPQPTVSSEGNEPDLEEYLRSDRTDAAGTEWDQRGIGWDQHEPRWDQHEPRWDQHEPRWDQHGPGWDQGRPGWEQGAPAAPAARKQRWQVVALVAAVVAVLVVGATVLLRSAFSEEYRSYANGATVVPFRLDHPAEWEAVVGLASDVVLAPDPSAVDQLFFEGGTPEAWAATTDALASGGSGNVGLYVYTSSTTFDTSRIDVLQQSIGQLLPETTRFESMHREVSVAGASGDEMEAVAYSPENEPRLRILVDVVQPSAGGAVLLAFFAPPDSFEDHRGTFERIRDSFEVTR